MTFLPSGGCLIYEGKSAKEYFEQGISVRILTVVFGHQANFLKLLRTPESEVHVFDLSLFFVTVPENRNGKVSPKQRWWECS